MIRLVSELTDNELLTRLHELEKYQLKLVEQLSSNPTQYETFLLNKKHDMALLHYMHAIYEAAYRKLITIH